MFRLYDDSFCAWFTMRWFHYGTKAISAKCPPLLANEGTWDLGTHASQGNHADPGLAKDSRPRPPDCRALKGDVTVDVFPQLQYVQIGTEVGASPLRPGRKV